MLPSFFQMQGMERIQQLQQGCTISAVSQGGRRTGIVYTRSTIAASPSYILPSTILLLLFLFSIPTPSLSQLIDPHDLLLARHQVQFPSLSPSSVTPRLLDTIYVDTSYPFQLYTPSPITNLTMNITFSSNHDLMKNYLTYPQAYIQVQLMNVSHAEPLFAQNISLPIEYMKGYYILQFDTLPSDSSTYYFNLFYWGYGLVRIQVTQDSTKITNSPTVLGGMDMLQYPKLWDVNAPATSAAQQIDSGSYGGFMLPIGIPQITRFVGQGAFTYELMFDMRRIADGKRMNEELALAGLTQVRAYWQPFTDDPPHYFNLSMNATNNPTLRVPRPPDRFADDYFLNIEGLRMILTGPPVFQVKWLALARLTEWTIQMEYGGDDTRLQDKSFALQSEEEYSRQKEDYYVTISSHQSYCLLILGYNSLRGEGGSILLQWQSDSSPQWQSSQYPYARTQTQTKVPLPVGDKKMAVKIATSIGQNFTWHFTRLDDVDTPITVNQTEVVLTYQSYENQLLQAAKNLSYANTTSGNQFQLVSQSGASAVALQRFTSNHSVTASVRATQFLAKTINVTVTPTTVDDNIKRDVYILALTPNPLVWVKPEPVVNEMELIPDSSAVSITLADTEGQSLTNSTLNQGNLTKLASYSYSVVQSYDTTSSCPTKYSCIPHCRIYDPVSSQWTIRDVSTEVIGTGTVRCSSSTPGTIALLRGKIVTRTDVNSGVDSSLRYGHAKNDMALIIGLLVVGGILFILMFVGGLLSFMRETRSMQAQINELKKAMMEGENELSRDRDDSPSKSQETSEVSFLPPPSAHHHDHHETPYLRSDDQLESPSIQVSLLESPSLMTVNSYSNYSYNPSPSVYLAPTTPFDLPTAESEAVLAGDLPFPRVSQLAPQFRPLSEEELAVQYGTKGYD